MISVLAALAVFAVSVTCTSAGCLLPAIEPNGPSLKPCCAGDSRPDPHPSHDNAPKHCPVCNQPILNGSGDIHNTGAAPFSQLVVGFVLPGLDRQASLPATASAVVAAFPPAVGPPTLLQLHCALLM
jgi:hypothetical protein